MTDKANIDSEAFEAVLQTIKEKLVKRIRKEYRKRIFKYLTTHISKERKGALKHLYAVDNEGNQMEQH